LAGAADDVLLAIDEVEHAVDVLAHDVAGVEPAAAPRLLGRPLVLEIAGKEAVARPPRPAPAHQELALRPARHLAVLLVGDLRLQPAERPTEGARMHHARLAVDHRDASGLRHAPGLDQRKAETLLERPGALGLDAGADAGLHRVLALCRYDGLVHQHRRHYAEGMHDWRPRRHDVLPPSRGAEALGQDQAIAGEHHARRR